jgi:glycosyltransferase involved in cell wall biosynthesis
VPLLSIIVPVYKVEQYLRRCVDSILAQTFTDFECILIDDGSPDNCPAICDEYAAKDHRIKVIHQGNGGLSAARNAGLKIVNGELVGFVDSDDWIAPDMYETLIKNQIKTQADIVMCGFYQVNNDICQKHNWEGIINDTEVVSKKTLFHLLVKDGVITVAWNKIYRTSLLWKYPFPVGKLCEDAYIMHKLFLDAEKIGVINECKYYYFQRTDSLMALKNIQFYIDDFIAFCNRYEDFKQIICVAVETKELLFEKILTRGMYLLGRFPGQINDNVKLIICFLSDNRQAIKEYRSGKNISVKTRILLRIPVHFLPLVALVLYNNLLNSVRIQISKYCVKYR